MKNMLGNQVVKKQVVKKQVVKPIVLQPQGSLSCKNAATFQQWITNVLLDSPTLCVLDMTHIDFIDSSGLFSLIAGLTSARQQQCRLVLCNLQPSVRMTLEIIQLDREFEIFESLEAIPAKLDLVNLSLISKGYV